MPGALWVDLLLRLGKTARARSAARTNLELCRDHGWHHDIARCYWLLGRAEIVEGRFAAAHQALAEAESTMRRGQLLKDLPSVLLAQAELYRRKAAYPDAVRYTDEALRIAAPRDLRLQSMPMPSSSGAVSSWTRPSIRLHQLDAATHRAQDDADAGLTLARQCGYAWAELDALTLLSDTAAGLGDHARANCYADEARALRHRLSPDDLKIPNLIPAPQRARSRRSPNGMLSPSPRVRTRMGIPTIDYDLKPGARPRRARLHPGAPQGPPARRRAGRFPTPSSPSGWPSSPRRLGCVSSARTPPPSSSPPTPNLDYLSDGLSKALLIVTKGNRSDRLYKLYYGEKRPSDLKRPTLGPQLETMRGWIPSLLASPHTMLADYGTQLQDKVAVADKAVAAASAAEQKNRAFRTVGERKVLIDDFNALRKATYGKLAEMPHTQPAAKLPASFADRFFRHEAWTPAEKPATSAEIAAKIAAKQVEMAALQAELTKTKADEEAAAQAKAQAKRTRRRWRTREGGRRRGGEGRRAQGRASGRGEPMASSSRCSLPKLARRR